MEKKVVYNKVIEGIEIECESGEETEIWVSAPDNLRIVSRNSNIFGSDHGVSLNKQEVEHLIKYLTELHSKMI